MLVIESLRVFPFLPRKAQSEHFLPLPLLRSPGVDFAG
jgi:hypothetical protein